MLPTRCRFPRGSLSTRCRFPRSWVPRGAALQKARFPRVAARGSLSRKCRSPRGSLSTRCRFPRASLFTSSSPGAGLPGVLHTWSRLTWSVHLEQAHLELTWIDSPGAAYKFRSLPSPTSPNYAGSKKVVDNFTEPEVANNLAELEVAESQDKHGGDIEWAEGRQVSARDESARSRSARGSPTRFAPREALSLRGPPHEVERGNFASSKVVDNNPTEPKGTESQDEMEAMDGPLTNRFARSQQGSISHSTRIALHKSHPESTPRNLHLGHRAYAQNTGFRPGSLSKIPQDIRSPRSAQGWCGRNIVNMLRNATSLTSDAAFGCRPMVVPKMAA